MKKLVYIPLLLVLMMFACKQNQEKLIIATAASAKFPMDRLIKEFTKESGIECVLLASSSGKLTAQIMKGAPFDVFISADMKYPKLLFENKLSLEPVVYAYGKLVLWTADITINPAINILTESQIEHIAIANPKTAPYGEMAIEALEYYNLLDKIDKKLIYGENVSQVNQFIISGGANIGLTSKSSMFIKEIKNKGHWVEIDQMAYTPNAQGAVVLTKNLKKQIESQAFLSFLTTSISQDILKEFGYIIPENE